MKKIRVVAAIIKRADKILATERGYGEFKDWWEFPGGKIEEGETPEEAIVREIREELDAAIVVRRPVIDVSYDYDTFHLDMRCFLCTLADESVTLLEHEAARWLDAKSLDSVKWLPADEQVITAIREQGIL
jgi:8-oxo-dGTP diphosphatase